MIRPRRDEDLERLVAVLRSVHDNEGYPTNWPCEPTRWLAPRATFGAWVAEEQGELVGHVALTAPDPERSWPEWQAALGVPTGGLGVMRRLFVVRDARRRGVASELVGHAAREAAERGLRLALDVSDDNHGAIAFWRRHGWREVGRAALPPGDQGRPLRLLLFVAPR